MDVMEVIRQPPLWDHCAVFGDEELLDWISFYLTHQMPRWRKRLDEAALDYRCNDGRFGTDRRLRNVSKDYQRTRQMLTGLETEARKRGLIP